MINQRYRINFVPKKKTKKTKKMTMHVGAKELNKYMKHEYTYITHINIK